MANIPVNTNDRYVIVTATANDQTDFDFDFLAFTIDQIAAKHIRSSDGVETDLIHTTNFTATGLSNANGGTISLIGVSIVNGDKVVIYGDTPIQRLSDFQQAGDFKADTVNTEEDLQTMMMQEMQRDVDRALKVPFGSQGDVFEVSAGEYIRRKADGSGYEGVVPNFALVVTEVDAWFQNRDFAAAQQAALLTDGSLVVMNGFIYKVDSSALGASSATNDLGVSGLVPHGKATPFHYGANGVGVTFDTAAMQAWASSGATFDLLIPHGEFWVDGTLTFPDNTSLVQEGGIVRQKAINTPMYSVGSGFRSQGLRGRGYKTDLSVSSGVNTSAHGIDIRDGSSDVFLDLLDWGEFGRFGVNMQATSGISKVRFSGDCYIFGSDPREGDTVKYLNGGTLTTTTINKTDWPQSLSIAGADDFGRQSCVNMTGPVTDVDLGNLQCHLAGQGVITSSGVENTRGRVYAEGMRQHGCYFQHAKSNNVYVHAVNCNHHGVKLQNQDSAPIYGPCHLDVFAEGCGQQGLNIVAQGHEDQGGGVYERARIHGVSFRVVAKGCGQDGVNIDGAHDVKGYVKAEDAARYGAAIRDAIDCDLTIDATGSANHGFYLLTATAGGASQGDDRQERIRVNGTVRRAGRGSSSKNSVRVEGSAYLTDIELSIDAQDPEGANRGFYFVNANSLSKTTLRNCISLGHSTADVQATVVQDCYRIDGFDYETASNFNLRDMNCRIGNGRHWSLKDGVTITTVADLNAKFSRPDGGDEITGWYQGDTVDEWTATPSMSRKIRLTSGTGTAASNWQTAF